MSNGKKLRPKANVKFEIGAYRLRTEIRASHDYMIVENVPKTWRVEWRDDNPVYVLVLSAIAESKEDGKSIADYLQNWFAMLFLQSSIMPDVPFMLGYHDLVAQHAKRHEEHRDELTDEEMEEQIALAHAAAVAHDEKKMDELVEGALAEAKANA